MKKAIIIILAVIIVAAVGIFISTKFSPQVIEEQGPLSELLVCDCCCEDSVAQTICVNKSETTLENIDEEYKANPPVCDLNVKCQLPKLFKYCQNR